MVQYIAGGNGSWYRIHGTTGLMENLRTEDSGYRLKTSVYDYPDITDEARENARWIWIENGYSDVE